MELYRESVEFARSASSFWTELGTSIAPSDDSDSLHPYLRPTVNMAEKNPEDLVQVTSRNLHNLLYPQNLMTYRNNIVRMTHHKFHEKITIGKLLKDLMSYMVLNNLYDLKNPECFYFNYALRSIFSVHFCHESHIFGFVSHHVRFTGTRINSNSIQVHTLRDLCTIDRAPIRSVSHVSCLIKFTISGPLLNFMHLTTQNTSRSNFMICEIWIQIVIYIKNNENLRDPDNPSMLCFLNDVLRQTLNCTLCHESQLPTLLINALTKRYEASSTWVHDETNLIDFHLVPHPISHTTRTVNRPDEE